MGTTTADSAAAALFGKTRRNILATLFGRPGEEFYLRQLAELTGSGRGATQRELENLVRAGIITRTRRGNRVFYRANRLSPVFRQLASITRSVVIAASQAGASVPTGLQDRFTVPKRALAAFCRRHHIRKLSLFGSVLRKDFAPESDVDVLVEFEPGRTPGFFGLADMEGELSRLLGGRKVDLRTPEELSRYFRDRVVREARVQYAAS
jgi:predicted nucleotidyltransferase/DNA-binding transcriptional ArsR family regulator